MSGIDPAWVEAGARALSLSGLPVRASHAAPVYATAVIAAVAPLIRAQVAAEVRERTMPESSYEDARHNDLLREIADDIERGKP